MSAMMCRLLVVLCVALATGSPVLAQSVQFEIDVSGLDLAPDATVGLRGDTAPLSWEASVGLADPDGDGVYSATLDFPPGTALVEYKAVIGRPGADAQWEGDDNRLAMPSAGGTVRRAFDGPQPALPAPLLTRAELAADLDVLRRGLETLHPGLSLHNAPDDLAAVFERLDDAVHALGVRHGDAIPMPDAYLAVARAVAALRDGHTQVSMFNQSPLTEAVLYRTADRVPFTFRLVGDRMIVTGDATDGGGVPVGTEILSLDGRPVAEVIRAMIPFASGDGLRTADRRFRLHLRDPFARAERFDVIYGLLFQPTGDLALRVRQPDGSEQRLSVGRVTDVQRRDRLWEREPSRPRSIGQAMRFEIRDEGTAVVRIPSFATFSMEFDYDTWLVDAFQQMASEGAERLVVDLRGTAGGADAAAVLLIRHLLDEPTQAVTWTGFTAFQRVPESLRPHVRSWSDEFYDLSGTVAPAGDGTFRLPVRPPVTLDPAPDAFAGPTAVLIDAAASSATFYLALQLQQAGAAVLVGQETGGSRSGITGGQMAFLSLPTSGIVVDVPLYASRPPVPGPDRGVIPDVRVPIDADAVRAGRDLEMEATIAHLRAH